MPRSCASAAFVACSIAFASVPAHATANADAPSPSTVQGRFGFTFPAHAVLDLTIGPDAWPVAFDATLVEGSSRSWRLGLATAAPPRQGFTYSAFGGIASAAADCSGGCMAFSYSAPLLVRPEFVAIGARTWFRGGNWWASISPSIRLALPGQPRVGYNWLDESLNAQIRGLLPPLAEIGYQVTPRIGIALRTSVAPLEVIVSI